MTPLCIAAADKYKHLSSAGIRGVIAGGIIGIICVAALALILKDLHGARKMKVSVSSWTTGIEWFLSQRHAFKLHISRTITQPRQSFVESQHSEA